MTITIRRSNRPLAVGLVLAAAACRTGDSRSAAVEGSPVRAALACASDSLHPVTAAPAAGLWVGGAALTATRVAAMIGPASTDTDRARITRRVETLELREGADTIRLATDTASVALELLPKYAGTGARAGGSLSTHTEPAAVYAVTPEVLIAAYEPCAASAGEPRLRYLRRDERGRVATDLMLRREPAETAAALP